MTLPLWRTQLLPDGTNLLKVLVPPLEVGKQAFSCIRKFPDIEVIGAQESGIFAWYDGQEIAAKREGAQATPEPFVSSSLSCGGRRWGGNRPTELLRSRQPGQVIFSPQTHVKHNLQRWGDGLAE